MCVWCGRGDLNPHDLLGSADFHTTSAFAASLGEFVVWTIPSPFPARGLGAARLVSTPSRTIRAWLGIAIQGFPDFEQFYSAGFPDGHSISLSPLCLPISPRPRKTDDSSHDKASGNGLCFFSQAAGFHSARAFLGNCLFLWTWPHDVDRGSIKLRLQMGRVILLNHLHACPAVLGNLVDVRTFEQAKANIGMAQAIGRSRPDRRGRCEAFPHQESR